ncbi:Hypothetical predicted protein, partial [Paramuricea clavata]
MKKFLEARREKKRRIDECWVALNTVRSSSLNDIVQAKWQEEDILAFLSAKYGHSTVEIGRYALKNFPPNELCPRATNSTTELGVLSTIINAGVPQNEAKQFIELLSECENFLSFTMSKALEENSKKLSVPRPSILLTPPNKLIDDGCLVCSSTLAMHNNSCAVTIFTITGPVRAMKVCWKCTNCGLNYNYSMYGSTEAGYKFYKDARPLIEASNVTYVERMVCNYQIHLANHAWVSFEGFAEAFNCAIKKFSTFSQHSEDSLCSLLSRDMQGIPEQGSQLDRRTVSSAFYWHEIEDELRKRNLSEWVFTGTKDENLDAVMKYIDQLRCGELYSHTEEDCSDDCRKRGCSNFVSMDGIWKLRFPHCMYPVKTTISGLPTVNYPDICPKEPISRTSAFCKEHCEIATTKGVPTELRKFLHKYCGIPRSNDGKKELSHVDMNVNSSDVQRVETTIKNLKPQTTASEVTEMQELLNISQLEAENNDPCNKDTGEKQKSLQKWSRGLLHYVRSGGHIDRWNPLFV